MLPDSTATANLFRDLTGLHVFNAEHGCGSFVTFSLTRTPEDPTEEFYVWIYMCLWKIRSAGEELAHAESSDEVIAQAVATLNGRKLNAVTLEQCVVPEGVFRAACLHFDQRLAMRLYQYAPDSSAYNPESPLFSTRDKAGSWVSYLGNGSIQKESADDAG